MRSLQRARLATFAPATSGWGFLCEGKSGAGRAFLCRLLLAGHCHTFGHPRCRLRLHPIQSFETGLKFVDWLNRAIGPFCLYFPILAIFKNHTNIGVRAVTFSPTHT